MLNTPFPDWPNFSDKEAIAVSKVLKSNKVNYWTGVECKKFENNFANYTNSKHAIAVFNGTVALDLALYAIDIKEGDEVIVPPRSYVASVSSIILRGGVPIFCDVCPNSQNIDTEKLEKLVTKKTKAILCVHLAGWPCDMNALKKIAKKYKLFLIEDCAQAHGAIYRKKSVGSIGDISCWSFCQDKIMTTGGEGGMVTTNSKLLWKKMWEYKDHGKSYDLVHKKVKKSGFRWLHNTVGTNYRMTEMQAAIGNIQLEKMQSWTKKRNKNQNKIWAEAKKHSCTRVPEFKCKGCDCKKEKSCVHGAYKAYIFIKKENLKKGWSRDRIMQEVNKLGVPCYSGSCSEIYLEKSMAKYRREQKIKNLANSKNLGDSSLMFLVHPNLQSKNIDKTIKVLNKVLEDASN
jgi:dTDP-4-amino-4,6-dideoxygalactose transaminase